MKNLIRRYPGVLLAVASIAALAFALAKLEALRAGLAS